VRDGDFRRHGGYFGKLVQRYLGARAAAAPSLLAGLRTTLSVLGAYIGLSVSLHALTGLPRVLWGALAFTVLAVMLLRGGLRIPAAVLILFATVLSDRPALRIAALLALAALAATVTLAARAGAFKRPPPSSSTLGAEART
jgi:hypothetical protein